jgi:FkbH-like protein
LESDLDWLPEQPEWKEALAAARAQPISSHSELADALRRFRALANARLDLALTAKLDRAVESCLLRAGAEDIRPRGFTRVRLAVLGSSTLGHLVAGIRVAGLRRGLLIEVYHAPYGTWRQELADRGSGLHAFLPDVLLLALDARAVADGEQIAGPGSTLQTLRQAWQTARESFGCAVIQQAALPVLAPVLGNAEHLLPQSRAAGVENFNTGLREAVGGTEGVHLLALDRIAAEQGLAHWHSPALWHRAKQEVHPAMAPLYGDQVARIIAALLGQTAKCLVLDLDHTLWGGGIGDEGLDRIEVGQGSALGEAHVELQRYALALRDRGILLAVCSKNDEINALLPFEHHPGMLLRKEHFACFVANWENKPGNLRRIARELDLGLDALVFVDDNPAERGLVRRELPEVQVPELSDDPAGFVHTLAAAGYFESVGITPEDRERAALYAQRARGNRHLASANGEGSIDLQSYLASLKTELEAKPFDASGKLRILQLINKTNQFNLTTRRVLDSEVDRLAGEPGTITMQVRLRDIYGDHGMIAVVVAEPATAFPEILPEAAPDDLLITHWLMSCRVLGRDVESATMALLVERAKSNGASRLFGRYIPTERNRMVQGLYPSLGFTLLERGMERELMWVLRLSEWQPPRREISYGVINMDL